MALREINLVPTEVLQQKYIARHIFLWAGGLVFFLGLIFGFYQYQVRMVLPQRRPVTTLEDMHVQLGATMEEINATQKEIERLSHQESFIKKLSTIQPFSRLLRKLSIIMNAQTWLTKLSINAGTEDDSRAPGIILYGFSLSNDDLGSFLTRLSDDPLFEDIVLKYAKETQKAGSSQDRKTPVKVIRFQIDLNISKS